eukprot:m51a1_g10447 hypothetical protein (402) ;mRNA; r:44338-45543
MVGEPQQTHTLGPRDGSAVAEGPPPELCCGQASVLLQGAHERLGERSPLAMLSGPLFRDLCEFASESLVVVDPAAVCPVSARTSGTAPASWQWRTGPGLDTGATRMVGTAAAQWGRGRVLVCGGSQDGGIMWAFPAVTRVYDVARGLWEHCPVPSLDCTDHTAVAHAGQVHVLGGFRNCGHHCRCAVQSVLADDGSRWTTREGPECPAYVDAACSLGGSLWALVCGYEYADYELCLSRFDPREGRWSDADAPGFREVRSCGASMAACGDCLYSAGGHKLGCEWRDDNPRDNGPTGRYFHPWEGDTTERVQGTARCQRLDVRMPSAWQEAAPLNEGRDRCGLVCLEGRQCLVAVGGNCADSSEGRQTAEVYLPAADKWYFVPDLPMPRQAVQKKTVALRTFC